MKKGPIKTTLTILLIFSGFLVIFDLIDFKDPIKAKGNIEDYFFVLTVAIDKAKEEGQKYRVTVVTEKFGGTDTKGQSSGKEQAINISEGKTVADAVSNFAEIKDKTVTWGQLKHILISEDVCKENILEITDFFSRAKEIRFAIDMFITKGSAEKVIELGTENKEFIPDIIDGLVRNIPEKSISRKISLRDYMSTFDNKYSDGYIPYIQIEEYEIANESKKKRLKINGYAIFSSNKIKGFIEDDVAGGLDFMNDDVQKTEILCKSSKGEDIVVEVIKNTVKKDVKLEGEKIKVEMSVNTFANIFEVSGNKKFSNQDEIIFIQNAIQDEIKKRMNQAIEYSKKNSVDIFKVNSILERQYKKSWDEMKDNYRDRIKDIDYKIDVIAKLQGTYLINEPIGSGE